MKALKSIAMGALALAAAGAANAQTVIRITGSTAYRNAVEQAILTTLKPGYVWGGVGKTVGGTQLIYSGNLNNTTGSAVIILTAFTGSEGGVFNLTHPSTPPANATYVVDSPANLALLTSAGYTGFTASQATDNTAADIAFADTYQASSAYKTPVIASDTKVGIVPFLWVAATTNDAGITNMTNQLAKAALSNEATLALWTGNHSASNESTPVWVIGRDPDSGTRDNTFLESGYGASTPPTQYAPVGTSPYASVALYPAETINGVSLPPGQGGYASGGSVGTAVADPSITVDSEIIGYIGTGDALAGLEASTLVPLTWNGVAFGSQAKANFTATYSEAAILNGSYTFWSYEHMLQSSTISSVGSTFATALSTEVLGGTEILAQGSGYKLSDVVNADLTRSIDGAPVYFTN